jgi:hypothetical protein
MESCAGTIRGEALVTFLITVVAIAAGLVFVATANTWWANKQRRNYLRSEYYQEPDLLARIQNKEIWAGMTRRHLLDSQGDPKATDTLLGNVEVFKYDRLGDTYRLRIRLENDVVTSWERDKS